MQQVILIVAVVMIAATFLLFAFQQHDTHPYPDKSVLVPLSMETPFPMVQMETTSCEGVSGETDVCEEVIQPEFHNQDSPIGQ